MKLFSGKVLVSLFAATAVLGVAAIGFSAWVINDSRLPELQGNVSVDVVNDNSFTVTVGEGEELQSLNYGAPAEAAEASGWLYSDGATKENLTLVYNFTFSNYTAGSSFSIEVSAADGKSGSVYTSPYVSYLQSYDGLKLYDGQEASYSNAVSAGLISDVSAVEITADVGAGSNIAYDNGIFTFISYTNRTCTLKVELTFSWGGLFGGENPYYSYRNLTGDKARVEAADTLSYLAACLNGVNYKITFVKE